MNELLQKHGCSNVFSIPDGLKELMCDISREVIREQPSNVLEFITKYLSALVAAREHGVMAMRVLEHLCDCKPSLSEHLMQLGLGDSKANVLANIIHEEIEGFTPVDEKEKIKESKILSRILKEMPLNEETAAQVCEIARNAYRDYWYRKNKLMEKSKSTSSWEIAAQHTLDIYKITKPTLEEMNTAALKIQAAFKGYYVRKNLQHLSHKSPNISTLAPVMTSGSRTLEFGPIINVKVQEDNIEALFAEEQHAYETGETICQCRRKIQNTPVDTMTSRPSETGDLPRSGSPNYADNDVVEPDSQSEWKDLFYAEATKKAKKDRDELEMSAPPGVLKDVTISVHNVDYGSKLGDASDCACDLPSGDTLENEQAVTDTKDNIEIDESDDDTA